MEAVREIPLDHDHRWKLIARLTSTPAGLEPFVAVILVAVTNANYF
jgi:hypothetical protein